MATCSVSPLVQPVLREGCSSQPVFEVPPGGVTRAHDGILPKMSRLPSQPDETPLRSETIDDYGYLEPQPGVAIPGALPYSPSREGVTYTRSRLPEITEDQIELWKALHFLRPLTSDYAGDFQTPAAQAPHPISKKASTSQCPFMSSRSKTSRTALDLVRSVLSWSDIRLPESTSGKYYGVVFRSKRAIGSESTDLYMADRLAHEEAVASGGLLMYFYGAPDPVTGMNLATCIWTSRKEARIASALPWHAEAAAHSNKAYESFELSRYCVVKLAGETTLRLQEWEDDD